MEITLITDKKAKGNHAHLIDKEHGLSVLSAHKGINSESFTSGTRYILGEDVTIIHHLGEHSQITLEKIRKGVHELVSTANTLSLSQLNIHLHDSFTTISVEEIAFAVAETVILSNYQFNKYFSNPKNNTLDKVNICVEKENAMLKNAIKKGQIVGESTCIARDLVNEPVITLNAVELAKRTQELGKKYGFKVEVLDKKKIESLKMGGILAVNSGSELPPTFSILEYKPNKPKNKNPIILVGKGIVYDTGGLSLKPTEGGMDTMKCDMAGAAAVIGAFCAIAQMKLNLYVIGLIPATDNRPGKNAYTPGDIIQMHSGSFVEVLNTDAEGRLILADALHFAKQYEPQLVIDLATLTGAAVVAVGDIGIAMMGTAHEGIKNSIKQAGEKVYERLVELPLWEEYGELLKSNVADMKNIGGRNAGAITAGKFLEHFTNYPWIHLDIAGPAFLQTPQSYRGRGGTGVGVRLLVEFLSQSQF
ncbi:MAG: leucyl aminopeptidase [Bacteroidia bacterium]|nr:leucyl aminopeptidase [Bacteroidia bacterium]MDW8348135.1 leucyl aminopeptidase [Bacteroidia bacterium]